MEIAEAMHLCQPCHARLHVEPLPMPITVVAYPLRSLGSRSDQTHFSSQYIQKLGKFGKAGTLHQKLVSRQSCCMALRVQTIHPEHLAILSTPQFATKTLALTKLQ